MFKAKALDGIGPAPHPPSRICLVTSEICGPFRNGGVGTHNFRLARLLARSPKYDVTVLYTGNLENGSLEDFQSRFARWNIRFRYVSEAPRARYGAQPDHWTTQNAHAVYRLLRSDSFDIVHFNDMQALGFFAIQAKRTGLHFQTTHLLVTMHGNGEWAREGMRMWANLPVDETKLDFMERYCCEHADLLLSPSQYLMDWVIARGWKLTAKRRVLPYPSLAAEGRSVPRREKPTDLSHVVFFGRLETRKGLEVFCRALENLVTQGFECVPSRITFLGKFSLASGKGAEEFLNDRLGKWPPEIRSRVHILSHLDSEEAISWLVQSGGVAVLPSLQDNLPFAALEMVETGVPFLASHVGGIPELAHPRVLFPPTAAGLTAALLTRETRLGTKVAHPYRPECANDPWLELHDSLSRNQPALPEPDWQTPLISVCVPFFNQGEFLTECLESIEQNGYAPIEVIVVDDGSTQVTSTEIFRQLGQRYAPRGWRFISHARQGVGATRNLAAREAKGELLFFLDADDQLVPGALFLLARGRLISRADAVVSHQLRFSDGGAGLKPDSYDCPIGGCLEAGSVENVFGGSALLIRKDIFGEIGGFREYVDRANEDWEFHARLVLTGKDLEVVPEPLVLKRVHGKMHSRSTSGFRDHSVVLKTYDRALPQTFHHFFSAYGAALSLRRSAGEQRPTNPPWEPRSIASPLNRRSFLVYRRLIRAILDRPILRRMVRGTVRSFVVLRGLIYN